MTASNHSVRRQQAAGTEPYPFFLLHLEEIEAWLEAGFPIKAVWRTYAKQPKAFPGNYRTFLRYCRQHGLKTKKRGRGRQTGTKSPDFESPAPRSDGSVQKRGPLRGPKPVGSVLGRLNMFPPPLERPPGFIPPEED